MKKVMIKSLKTRFAGVEENKLLSIATIVNPHFKDKFFSGNIIKTTVSEMLEEEIQKTIDNDRIQSQQTAVQKSPNLQPNA